VLKFLKEPETLEDAERKTRDLAPIRDFFAIFLKDPANFRRISL